MIGRELIALANEQPTLAALRTSVGRWTYRQLASVTTALARELSANRANIAGIWCQEPLPLVASLAAHDLLLRDAVLFGATASETQLRQSACELKVPVVLTDQRVSPTDVAGPQFQSINLKGDGDDRTVPVPEENIPRLILFTSGTSGRPKPAVHTWQTLAAGINRDSKYHRRRWFSAYDPTSYAGLQGWLQALLTAGSWCVPSSNDPAAVAELFVQEQVEFASATPSFWRLFLLGAGHIQGKDLALVQLTLGGEAVDQDLLDRLHAAFPHARITHIYASTEMGVCFSVRDGKAGFPAAYLSDRSLPCQLRIAIDGELEIRSKRAMLGYFVEPGDPQHADAQTAPFAPWFATGDLVERHGERVYFVGRKSETINVGGRKVYPADVEQLIRAVPGVRQVRVFGIPSSITGQLVSAEVEPMADVDRADLHRRIFDACRQHLARHQLPTSIAFCGPLQLNASGKLPRAEALYGV